MGCDRRSRWFGRWIAALAFAIAAPGVGCSSSCGDNAADVVLPPEKEEKLGDKVERQFLDSDVEVYQGEMVESYVQNLGSEAVQAAGADSPEPIEYEFKVIDDAETINAFAMPGGQIYFYTGLLTLAESQAEVMAVMSHEVAHVSQRHIAKQLVIAHGIQAVAGAATGENPGLVAKLVTRIAATGAMLKFSREHEKEADKVGFDYMVEAGYNPKGFVTFFKKLDQKKKVQLPTWLSSHPLPEDRIQAAKERMGDKSYEDKTVGKEVHREIVRAIEGMGGGGGDLAGETGSGSSDGSDGGL